jgi:hypothetical protein
VQVALNTTYQVAITANGNAITVLVNGVQFWSGTDSSHTTGSVAMYNWRNSNVTYDNVIVRGIAPTASLVPVMPKLGGPSTLLVNATELERPSTGEIAIRTPQPLDFEAEPELIRLERRTPIDELVVALSERGVQ